MITPNTVQRGGIVVIALVIVVASGLAGAFVFSGTGDVASAATINTHGDEPVQSAVGTHPPAQEQAENGTENRSAASVIRNVNESYANIEAFNATFVSTSHVSNGTETLDATNTTATLSVQRPDAVRFTIRKPAAKAGSVIVSNDTTTTVYNATNDTVRAYDFPLYGETTDRGALSETNRAAYLGGIADTLARSNVSYEGTKSVAGRETHVLSVTPRATMNATAGTASGNLTYYLDRESYLPVKTVTESTVEYDDETVTYRSTTSLRDLQTDADVPDSVFAFTPPENATYLGDRSPGITSYDSVADAQQNTEITFATPTQIPEGFSFESAAVTPSDDNESVGLRYINGSENPINNSFSVGISTRQPELRANDTHGRENVTINGHSGTYFRAGEGIVMFPVDGLRYTVSGPFSKATLVSIAESIGSSEADENVPNGTANETPPTTNATTYYQIDLVRGEPIEHLDWPDGTYTNDQLIRFAHGSTDEAVTRRSEGEFTTDDALADRIDSRNITVANGTATATFTVSEGDSVTLSLASYTKPDPVWDPEDEDDQVFVDGQSRTYDSGTHTLTVDLPDEGTTAGTNGTTAPENETGNETGSVDNATTLTVLSYNDIQTAAAKDETLPRLVHTVTERRAAHDNPTLVMGAGDEISPHALSTVSQWHPPVDVLNLVDPAADTIGNHDLDYGTAEFENASDASDFPWVSTNLVNTTTGEPVAGAQRYRVIEKDGVRVGVLGVVLEGVDGIVSPDLAAQNVTAKPIVPTVEKYEDVLRQKEDADVVVALVHSGVTPAKEIANATSVDVALAGHDEVKYAPTVTNGTIVSEGQSNAAFVGEINLTIRNDSVTNTEGRLIEVTNATPKNDTASGIINDYRGVELPNTNVTFDEVIVRSETPLRATSANYERETGYGNLITDAMRNGTGADVAITNAGGIRSDTVYGPGNITAGDVYNTLPFGNTLTTVELTGTELRETLESQVVPTEGSDYDGEISQQVSGVRFEWIPHTGVERKIRNVTVNGDALDPDATYTVAVNSFIADGGSGYPLADKPRVGQSNTTVATAVIDYLQGQGTIAPAPEGRMQRVDNTTDASASASMASG